MAGLPCVDISVVLFGLGLSLARKSYIIANERHIVFATNYPACMPRHRTPGTKDSPGINAAFVHEAFEQFIRLVFAEADVIAYALDLGVGVQFVPPAFTIMHGQEHPFTLLGGKLLRHHTALSACPNCYS
jgi:hypothetical protein